MPTLDERLRDLARDTHGFVDPSPELLSRIRIATTNDSRRRVRARPVFVLTAAAAAVVILVLAFWLPRGTRSTEQVATEPMTKAGFDAQADQACRSFAASANQSGVVFATPDVKARVLLGATQRLLDDVDLGVDLSPKGRYRLAPPDARPVLVAVNADLRGALDQLRAAKAQTASGPASAHLAATQSALNAAHTLTGQAAARLANYGAQACTAVSP
jgi:hypothetical protein